MAADLYQPDPAPPGHPDWPERPFAFTLFPWYPGIGYLVHYTATCDDGERHDLTIHVVNVGSEDAAREYADVVIPQFGHVDHAITSVEANP